MVGCVLSLPGAGYIYISVFIIKTHLTSPQTSVQAGARGKISQHHISTSGDIAWQTNHSDHATQLTQHSREILRLNQGGTDCRADRAGHTILHFS